MVIYLIVCVLNMCINQVLLKFISCYLCPDELTVDQDAEAELPVPLDREVKPLSEVGLVQGFLDHPRLGAIADRYLEIVRSLRNGHSALVWRKEDKIVIKHKSIIIFCRQSV